MKFLIRKPDAKYSVHKEVIGDPKDTPVIEFEGVKYHKIGPKYNDRQMMNFLRNEAENREFVAHPTASDISHLL